MKYFSDIYYIIRYYFRDKDMNDFVLMLTATLRLSHVNELTDSGKTLIEDDDSQNRMWSTGERTIAGPLHETNFLHQRCQSIRE